MPSWNALTWWMTDLLAASRCRSAVLIKAGPGQAPPKSTPLKAPLYSGRLMFR